MKFYSNEYRVTKILKPTKAKGFKEIEIGLDKEIENKIIEYIDEHRR